MDGRNNKRVKNGLLAIVLLFLLIPILQEQFSLRPEPNLEGAYNPVPDMAFSKNDWLSGEFQAQKAEYLSDNFGFRKTLMRGFNELRYRLFKTTNARGVVVGKDNILFEQWYIASAMGRDFMGENVIKTKADKLAAVRDTLESLGKDLIVVLAPGKGTYHSEAYPPTWSDTIPGPTNSKVFTKMLAERDLNVLDVQNWFLNARDTTQWPLFPRTGIHWSKYGEYLVMDSLIKTIEIVRGVELTQIVLDSVTTSTSMQDTDDDIERSMNLIWDIPDFEMRYPYFHFSRSDSAQRPKVLTISDSFNWGMFNAGFSQEVYAGGEFWYYFKDIYPLRDGAQIEVDDLFLLDEYEALDAIVLMCTEINIYSFDFIEKSYDIFYNDAAISREHDRRVAYYKQLIKADPNWLKSVTEQAAANGISVEESIQNNAEYMVWQESQQ